MCLMPEEHMDGPRATPPTACVETCARCPMERTTPAEPAATQAEDVAPSCAPASSSPRKGSSSGSDVFANPLEVPVWGLSSYSDHEAPD